MGIGSVLEGERLLLRALPYLRERGLWHKENLSMKTETRAPIMMPESGIGSPWNLGVTAALWMTALMFAHRLFFGIASVPGLITERVIPLVPGEASGDILGIVGQAAKLIPELSAIVAQLVVGGMIGAWYARSWGKEDAPAWKRWAFGPLVALGLWLATLAALWPVLIEHYHGRPPGAGRALSIVAIFVDYLFFGMLLPVLFVVARREERMSETSADARRGVSRRQALSFIGGGALIASATGALQAFVRTRTGGGNYYLTQIRVLHWLSSRSANNE